MQCHIQELVRVGKSLKLFKNGGDFQKMVAHVTKNGGNFLSPEKTEKYLKNVNLPPFGKST